MITHNWLWLDLETTGLVETDGEILEIAMAVVDDGPEGTFEVIDSCETVILNSRQTGMHPTVLEMHTRNGLLAAIAQGEGLALGDAEPMCEAFVDQYLPAGKQVLLAGNSVHFDLRWIKVHMPKLAARFSHRVFDVSTLGEAARVWAGEALPKGDAHRAMLDVRSSIRQAKSFLDMVRA